MVETLMLLAVVRGFDFVGSTGYAVEVCDRRFGMLSESFHGDTATGWLYRLVAEDWSCEVRRHKTVERFSGITCIGRSFAVETSAFTGDLARFERDLVLLRLAL